MKVSVACVQLNSINDLVQNHMQIAKLVRKAAQKGAKFITLPENASFMADNAKELFQHACEPALHPTVLLCQELARELGCWILIGSLAVRPKRAKKLRNRSFLINPDGVVVTHYDKIHLYDASPKGGESHQESKRYVAGNKIVSYDLPWGRLGLTICYDIRFPHLYRKLAQGGAEIITVPSAFTEFTGEAHWLALLKARAIETASYIVAPAQTGSHPAGRKTFGHSLIIDPWGEILADAGKKPGVIVAELDFAKVAKIRETLPSVHHEPGFSV